MKAFKFGDNIDTDVIIPARYLNSSQPEHLAAHCMEDADASFAKNVRPGDFIIGGENFGCGSSREHAPIAIKACGIKAVVAKSFARIFYRNAINIGLSIVVCPRACDEIEDGDELSIDFDTGKITDLTTGKVYYGDAFPPFIRSIIDNGGLLNSIDVFLSDK